MVELIIIVLLTGLLGSFGVPIVVLLLARFGHFEPLEFTLFGRTWRFAPKVKIVSTVGGGTQGYKQDSWIMVGTTATFLAVIPPLEYSHSAIARATGITQARATGGIHSPRVPA